MWTCDDNPVFEKEEQHLAGNGPSTVTRLVVVPMCGPVNTDHYSRTRPEGRVGPRKQARSVAPERIPRSGKTETVKAWPGIVGMRQKTPASNDSHHLVSFLGISPTLKQSGSSVHSRGHISRLGNTHVRRSLYFCAITATRFNPQCRAMWLRMKEQKKPTKVILMAIANKLIRQIHALIRTNTSYDPNFCNLALAN